MTLDNLTLTRFFIAILLLLVSAHFFGNLFSRLHLPKVVGEILGGLLLGPTCLGDMLPDFYRTIFLDQGELVAAVYWLGLVLLMFVSGFEIQKSFEPKDKRIIAALVAGTTVIPFVFGWVSTYFFDLQRIMGPADNPLSLKLIVVVALAVTSIPVISKIFLDLGIIHTPFAKITLATATLHDIILWVFVSIATGLVSSKVMSVYGISLHVVISILFFVITLVVIPRLIGWVGQGRFDRVASGNEPTLAILILLLFTVMASLLEVNLVFGAFLAGVVVNFLKGERIEEAKLHIKNFSMAFFVPVYFAVVGIKLDLIRHFDAAFFVSFTLFAFAVQTAAVLATARWLGYNGLSSFNLAMALNNRGGPCIVLASVAFDLGIITESFFVTLVLLAIVTSLSAGSWLKYVLNRQWPLLDK